MPGREFLVIEELFLFKIGCKFIKKRGNVNILYLKILKKSDKMKFTLFSTIKSNIVPKK